MILYIENAKESPPKLLELINKFNKSAVFGYKISLQNTVPFLYTNNKTAERKIKKTTPFIIASKPKYL